MTQLIDLLRFDPHAPLLFTGGQFLFWLSMFLPGFALLRRSEAARLWLTALFSCFFFYKCSGALLGLLLFTAGADFLIAQRIADSGCQKARRRWLWLSIALSAGALVYFKYAGFLLGGVAAVTGMHLTPLDLVAPAGISFYTFETISYVVDVYRGRLPPTRRFREYLAYLAYFPHLMAGPIMRAADLLPSLRKTPEQTESRLGSGLFLILGGLCQKAILADYLATFTDSVFSGGAGLSGFELLLGVYAYAAQIFCDFAGYSAMALGLGRLTGVELPVNFDAPYAATSLTDFWRRWHITLSTWLRDYIYVPLGGNRRGRLRTAINLILTMSLGGLWHGAGLNFVAWGLGHGLLLSLERLLTSPLERLRAGRAGRALSIFITLHLVLLLWVPFRAPSLHAACELLRRIAGDFQSENMSQVLQSRGGLIAAALLGLGLGMIGPRPLEALAQCFARAPVFVRAGLALAAVQLTLELRASDVQPFIYFQF